MAGKYNLIHVLTLWCLKNEMACRTPAVLKMAQFGESPRHQIVPFTKLASRFQPWKYTVIAFKFRYTQALCVMLRF